MSTIIVSQYTVDDFLSTLEEIFSKRKHILTGFQTLLSVYPNKRSDETLNTSLFGVILQERFKPDS